MYLATFVHEILIFVNISQNNNYLIVRYKHLEAYLEAYLEAHLEAHLEAYLQASINNAQ